MNKPPALLLSIALMLATPAALAQQPGMKVNVLIVESVDDFVRWVQQEAAAATAAKEQKIQRPYPRSLKEVQVGKRIHFPIVVSELRPPEQGSVTLVADAEFFGPDGKSVTALPKCCRHTLTNKPDVRTAMLGPIVNLELDAGDMRGTYAVRVSVTDGTQKAATSQTFQFTGGKSAAPPQAPAPTAAPTLRMDTPPAKNPGRDVDKRDCLALPTPSEVIKCTERK